MITQLSSGGEEWRANNYHPAVFARPRIAWASHEEGAGTPGQEIKDTNKKFKFIHTFAIPCWGRRLGGQDG